MKETKEIEFKATKQFARGRRLPFIRISRNSNGTNISVAAAEGMSLLSGDKLKLSQSKNKNIYFYKETVEGSGGINVCLVQGSSWRTSVKQLPDTLFKMFGIKEDTYRLYIDIVGEEIIVTDKDNAERVVTGYRIMDVPHLNKEV